MGWPGEKQRHSMSARGIPTAIKDYNEQFEKHKVEFETKLEKEVQKVFGNDYDIEIGIHGDEIFVSVFPERTDAFIYTGRHIPSVFEYADEIEHESLREQTIELENSLQADFFNRTVKPEEATEIIEKYGDISEWMMKEHPKAWKGVLAVRDKSLEDLYDAPDEVRDGYRDHINGHVDETLRRMGTSFTGNVWYENEHNYGVYEITTRTNLENIEKEVKTAKSAILSKRRL